MAAELKKLRQEIDCYFEVFKNILGDKKFNAE